MFELRPSSCVDVNPLSVRLVVRSNLIEVDCFGETFPKAGVLDSHVWRRAEVNRYGELLEIQLLLPEPSSDVLNLKRLGREPVPVRSECLASVARWRLER